MQKAVDIADEIKKHEDVWLLFEVVETDDIDRPIRGRLIARSESRRKINELALKHVGLDLQTVYTGELPDMMPIL